MFDLLLRHWDLSTERFCQKYQIKGLENIKNLCQEELRIIVLLYADDSIIFSESATKL